MSNVATLETLTTGQNRLTKEDKLLHLAHLCRIHLFPIRLYDNLEMIQDSQLPYCATFFPAYGINGHTPFSIARDDKKFRADGLPPAANLAEILAYLEIERAEYHAFGTNKGEGGGQISNRVMAERIEALS